MEKYNGKTNNYKKIGTYCRDFRMQRGTTLLQVSQEVGTSPSNIRAFETGRNDNYNILIWYINHGFNLETAIKIIEVEDKQNETI